MSYPGNPSLSADVQQRIRGTFEHTLTLASAGNRQEAVLGCEFVLRMDPSFEPARRLQERLAASNGPIAVDDLRALLDGRPLPRAAGPGDGDSLFSDLDPDALPDLPDLFDDAPVGAAGGLVGEFERLLEQRRFQELLNRARQESAELATNFELRRLAELAEERLEAGPYVNKFLSSVREMVLKGDRAEAERLLDKARSLDSSHPGIAEAAATLASLPQAAATAAPGAPAAVGGGLDFGAAALSSPGFSLPGIGGGGDEPRIRELLDEGQAALERGDPQGAIDVWSRIFLIDIDHQEASRRIEGARRQKAERERQVEEIFHDGVGRLDAKDLAGARSAFEQVLLLQPEHLGAREYLEQLRSGTVPAGSAAGGMGFPRLPELPADSGADLLAPEIGAAGELREEILIPPDPIKNKGGAAAKGKAPKRPGDGTAKRRFLLAGVAGLLLVGAVGLYVWLNYDTLFPNSAPEAAQEAAPAPAAAPDPIARARALHENGKTAIALAQLKRLPPSAPQYAEAQKLIAEWEGGAPAAPEAVPSGAPPSADDAVRRDSLLAEARTFFNDRRFLRAEEKFQEAGRIAALAGTDAEQSAEARRQLEPILRLIALVRKENEWEIALPDLWRLYQADPTNRDLQTLINDSYYNLGVRDLQRYDAQKAADNFNEALKVDPRDAESRKRLLFAQAYRVKDKDLLYRIYVKYLPSR